MNRARYVLALIALAASQPALAADSLCNVIQRFEVAPPKADQAQNRRWIEFHWGFDHSPDSLWSWGCRHSDQLVATQTCVWLKDHTNQEFSMMLPQEIMACYGYKFPQHAANDWRRLSGTIRLHGRPGQDLLLELAYRDLPKGEVAMRLAIEVEGVEYDPDELPGITPFPEAKPK